MANWLIRTVKIKTGLWYNGYWNSLYSAYDYAYEPSSGEFKESWADEWIIDTGDILSYELQFIVNAICHAEKQLYLDCWHLYVECYDMAHYVSLDNDSGCIVMHPIGSTENAGQVLLPEANANYGVRRVFNSDGTYTEYHLLNNPRSLKWYYRPSGPRQGYATPEERALIVTRDTYEGAGQRRAFFRCVEESDTDITPGGTITLHGGGDLLATRWQDFKRVIRYVAGNMTSYGIDKDGYLTYKTYATEGFEAHIVSDFKAQDRKWRGKSVYSRRTYSLMRGLMLPFRAFLEEHQFLAEQNNYSIEGAIQNGRFGGQQRVLLMFTLQRLLHWFPYLANGLELEEELLAYARGPESEFLVPEFNYFTFRSLFFKLLKYYRWYLYFEDNAWRCAYFSFGYGAWPENVRAPENKDADYHLTHFPLPYNTPQTMRSRFDYWRDNYWNSYNYILQAQSIIAKIERMWDVRSWDASLNVKPPKIGPAWVQGPRGRVSRRDGVKPGKSYPRSGIHGGATPRQARNKWKVDRDMERGETHPNNNQFTFWGSYEFSGIPISGPRYADAPPPPKETYPPKRTFRWDNTIHPLTAEEEDAEAISLLEEIEENVRAVGHAEWGITKNVIAIYTKEPVNPLLDAAVDVGVDIISDEINPTDRTQIEIPGTNIIFSDDGSIPTTFDGKKLTPATP